MNDQIKNIVRETWANFPIDSDISIRLSDLLEAWDNFVICVAESYGFKQKEGGEETPYCYLKKMRIERIYKRSLNIHRRLSTFSHVYKACQTNSSMDGDQYLEENGSGEESFRRLLDEVTNYMAIISGLEVPEKISKYCGGDQLSFNSQFSDDDDDLLTMPCDRFPVVFIIDTSVSMCNFLETLQDGIRHLIELLHADERLRQQVELYVITTTGKKLLDFSTIKDPEKIIGHINLAQCWSMSTAKIVNALRTSVNDLIKKIKSINDVGVDSYCPWIIIISNGVWNRESNKDFDVFTDEVKKYVEEKAFKVYVRTLIDPKEMSDSQREMVKKLDPEFGVLKESKNFFKTAFQSICRMKVTSPACDDEMKLL